MDHRAYRQQYLRVKELFHHSNQFLWFINHRTVVPALLIGPIGARGDGDRLVNEDRLFDCVCSVLLDEAPQYCRTHGVPEEIGGTKAEMLCKLLEVNGEPCDSISIVDSLRKLLVARIEHEDVILLAEQKHEVDVLSSACRPAGDKDEGLAFAGFPIGEL